MHDVLHNRVLRKIESLPEEQIYQILDYIEFLESKYSPAAMEKQASGFQRLGEGIEDGLRKRSFNPSNLREAFQVIAAADRALSGVAKAGRKMLGELAEGGDGGRFRGPGSGRGVVFPGRRGGPVRHAGRGQHRARRLTRLRCGPKFRDGKRQ